jgi:indolepyruvate ferredoxin oxidoreductase beta subunit
MQDTINFLLAGVGGQGTILAADVLVNVGMAAGYQVKQAEVHGMSQRGGSVTSHVRWGRVVYSPLVGAGEVDVYLAFEKAEALRNLNQLRRGALAVVNMQAIEPVTVTSGGQLYPDDDRLVAAVSQVTDKVAYVDGEKIAGALGNMRVANVVLLGALSALIERERLVLSRGDASQSGTEGPVLFRRDAAQSEAEGPTRPELTPEVWLKVIAERVPAKYVELNRKAFQAGREAA